VNRGRMSNLGRENPRVLSEVSRVYWSLGQIIPCNAGCGAIHRRHAADSHNPVSNSRKAGVQVGSSSPVLGESFQSWRRPNRRCVAIIP